MDQDDSAEGPSIVFKPEAQAENARSRWLWSLAQFREAFEWQPAAGEEAQDWWIASTAIPLVAATTAPMANLMSVVALVTPWRSRVYPDQLDSQGRVLQIGYSDPHWCIALNASSLGLGVLGNLFLLFNFTQKMRYIIALPASVFLWFLATGILAGLTASIHIYVPPQAPDHVYSQGYWSAVIAAVLYFILAVILMVNMLGYMLGHYPQHFALTDDQRTLILQTTSLMVWLAVGGAIFQQLIDISFADALYFSDVTVLTLGYGDITATSDLARGLIFPYAVIGIIILALIIASITRFAREVTNANVVKSHLHHKRVEVLQHSMTIDQDATPNGGGGSPTHENHVRLPNDSRTPIRSVVNSIIAPKKSRTVAMSEEKDRFNAMRAIQNETLRFRRWMSLLSSLMGFAIVWCGGAGVFSRLEHINYFSALYFAFCSLLTIGYGDITPESNGGRAFFIVWSLVAIPTMTILISKMSDTIMSGVDNATNYVAEFTLLPTTGRYRRFVSKVPLVRDFLERRAERKRIKRGFRVGVNDSAHPDNRDGNNNDNNSKVEDDLEHGDDSTTKTRGRNNNDDNYDTARPPPHTIEELEKHRRSPHQLARDLIFAIRRVTQDVMTGEIKRYSFEEWVEFTLLIRFTNPNFSRQTEIELDENEWGIIEWDWIGENSPMMAEQTEPEWLLNRLTESLLRYMASIEPEKESEEGQQRRWAVDAESSSDSRDENGQPSSSRSRGANSTS